MRSIVIMCCICDSVYACIRLHASPVAAVALQRHMLACVCMCTRHLRGLRARTSARGKAAMIKQQRMSLVEGDGGPEERKARKRGALALCAALKRNQNFTGVVLGQLEQLDASLHHNMRQQVHARTPAPY